MEMLCKFGPSGLLSMVSFKLLISCYSKVQVAKAKAARPKEQKAPPNKNVRAREETAVEDNEGWTTVASKTMRRKA